MRIYFARYNSLQFSYYALFTAKNRVSFLKLVRAVNFCAKHIPCRAYFLTSAAGIYVSLCWILGELPHTLRDGALFITRRLPSTDIKYVKLF